jgi:hypothetical protein
MKVKVYYNLRKKCFSVQHKGIVIAHKDKLVLNNVQFKVSEAGRQRVLKEKRKNVHAYAVGDLCEDFVQLTDKTIDVTYNPYLYSSFVNKKTLKPVHNAKTAWFQNKQIKIT